MSAIRWHLRVAGKQSWLASQMASALLLLNLVGGDYASGQEQDSGFDAVLKVRCPCHQCAPRRG
jgi:hypothetical protein